jgi:hypothetical protein
MRLTRISSGYWVSIAVIGIVAILFSFVWAVPQVKSKTGDEEISSHQIRLATGLDVLPGSVFFLCQEFSSVLESLISWREIVFLAAAEKGAPSDLYRLEVRMERSTGIIAARGLKNISQSPVGDDYKVFVSPPYVMVATKLLGQVRSLTLLNFNGQTLSRDSGWTVVSGVLARLTDFQQTGRYRGVGKTTLRFAHPPKNIDISLFETEEKEVFSVSWMDRHKRLHNAFIDMVTGDADDGDLLTTAEQRLPKPFILWLVDTVRSLPFIGPGPIEWAEGRFFFLRDLVKRQSYRFFGDEVLEEEQNSSSDNETKRRPFKLPPGLEVGRVEEQVTWPPPPVKPPVFKRLARGEGKWTRPMFRHIRTLKDAPPPIYKTYIRPDLMRPYVNVSLVAMDMRQLELHMVGGHEDPQSTTGIVGTGKIPRRREILSRLVVAFNGAIKTLNASYGMVVERDILLPPKDRAATIAALEGGQTAMGSWPPQEPIPENLISLRQNLDPLVEGGVVNPRRRYLWGFTLSDDIREMNTVRSGVCMTDGGALIYAWGEDLTAQTLGIAMNAVGCVYGMHLDMNPLHTAFIYFRFTEPIDLDDPKFKARLAEPQMRYLPDRYVGGAPKDFFFLTLRGRGPGPKWRAEGLAQPAPAYVPAVFKLEEASCKLIAVDLTRTKTEIVSGTVPFELVSTAARDQGNDEENLLLSLPIGQWSSGRGQLVHGTVVASLSNEKATLASTEKGELMMGMWPLDTAGESLLDDAVQSNWLVSVSSSDRLVTACGFVAGNWLVVGQGPAGQLSKLMAEQKVRSPIVFNVEEGSAGMAVRTEKGLIDGEGNYLSQLDSIGSALRVFAHPRRLGATRLESMMKRERSE